MEIHIDGWVCLNSPIAQRTFYDFILFYTFPEIILVPSKIKLLNSNRNIYFGYLWRKFQKFFTFFFFWIPSSKQIVPTSLFSYQSKTPKDLLSYCSSYNVCTYCCWKNPIHWKLNAIQSHWIIGLMPIGKLTLDDHQHRPIHKYMGSPVSTIFWLMKFHTIRGIALIGDWFTTCKIGQFKIIKINFL